MSHRLSSRARELRACADLIAGLARVPDRATPKDFAQVADLIRSAASDLEELVTAVTIGCVCRRVQGDTCDYLDYREGCLHHAGLHILSLQHKEVFARLERDLRNEVRLRMVAAALTGTAAASGSTLVSDALRSNHGIVERAIAIADEAIRQITETA